jgi:Uma2 family endonuclease
MTATSSPVQVLPQEQHFLLHDFDWLRYDALLALINDRHVYVTYDRGRVELMSPSWEHENRSDLIGTLIRSVADGFKLPVKGGGSTTFRRIDLDRGLEPDRCFYVRNEHLVRDKKVIDLSIDPPPDLCVEVEVSQRLLDRVGIYAALGVPELWRDNGFRLRIFKLDLDRTYVETGASLAFPTMSAERLNRYLGRAHGTDETTWARKVRRAARNHRPT